MNRPQSANPIWWDPLPEQLGIEQDGEQYEIEPDGLRSAGYEFFAGDCTSINNACIWMWKHRSERKWYLALAVNKRVFASALVFSSNSLVEVIDGFAKIAGAL